MEEKSRKVLPGALFLTAGFFIFFLFIDAAYFSNKIFGFVSLNFFNVAYKYFGDFTLLYFSALLVIGFLFLIPYNLSSKIFVFAGYISLILFMPAFISGIVRDGANVGMVGSKINEVMGSNGALLKYASYFVWVALTFFLLLFPIKEHIAFAIFSMLFGKSSDKAPLVKNGNSGKIKSNKYMTKTEVKKYNRNDIPWLSKVVYESSDKRIETPVFKNNDIPVKKFKLKTTENNIEQFNEVDTLSDKTIDDVQNAKHTETKGFINLHQMDNDEYYKKLKDSWPNEWKDSSEDDTAEITDSQGKTSCSVVDGTSENDEKLSIYDMIEDDEPMVNEDQMVPDTVCDTEIETDCTTENVEDNQCEVFENEAYIEPDGEIEQVEDLADIEPDGEIEQVEDLADIEPDGEIEQVEDLVDIEPDGEIEQVEDLADIEPDDCINNVDSIDGDDLKKFVDENMNSYLSSRIGKSDENVIDYHDELDDFDGYEGDFSDEIPVCQSNFPDKEMLDDVIGNYDSEEYRRIENEDATILENTLGEFGIRAEVCDIIHGPVVTLFKLVPAPGIKLSKIESLSDNLALRLAAQCIRIIAPIPGEKVVGIEVPNKKRELVSFKEVVNSEKFTDNNFHIPIGIGKDIYGNIIVIDLHRMPHVLIAGATGAGKSVCVNGFLSSILFSRSPDDVRLILIDPKIVELQPYDGIPHLLTPVITDPKSAINALKYLVYEMEERYALLGKIGVRDIGEYRKMIKDGKLNFTNMPYIVAFVDEFADLMSTSGKEAEMLFARLTAKARAVGIHLILATQRPSTDVITGLIKSNVPARFAFQVISYMDSRIILDQKGAEKLLGQGDMLYLSPSQPFPVRIQGAYLSKEEVDLIANHWKGIAEPDYIDIGEILGIDDEDDSFSNNGDRAKDPLFDDAVEIVLQTKKASASYLQRRLNIGYNRAARMVEDMESMGIVGPMQGSKPREIIGNPNM